MPETFKTLYRGQPGTTSTELYQAPTAAGNSAIIKHIRIVNTSSTTAYSIQLNHSSAASNTAGTANIILPAVSIDASGFAELDGLITMGASEKIWGIVGAGGANTITVTIYGAEIT